jgi:alkyldihydroxyacetonephosphate synthase
VLCAAWCTMQKVMDAIKKFYVTQYHGFEPLEICAATLLFEGSDEEVRSVQAAAVIRSDRHGHLPACLPARNICW